MRPNQLDNLRLSFADLDLLYLQLFSFGTQEMARNQKGTNRLQLCAHLEGLYKWADVLKKQWKCYTHSIFCHCIIFMDLYMSQGSQDSKKHGSSQLGTKKVRVKLAFVLVPGRTLR